MQVLSEIEKSDLKCYLLEDNGQKYVGEEIFPNKNPRSRIVADIKKSIERIIAERGSIIKHSSYIQYQKMEQIEGEYCLLRQGTEVYKSLSEHLSENQLTLDEIVDWMIAIGEIALEGEKNSITWQDGITMESLWIDQNGELRLLDPDIANILSRYRDIDNIKPVEVYRPPEIFKNKPRDQRSLIYSAGIIMYYLITGEIPFDVSDKSDLVHEILNNNPVEPIYLNPEMSPALNGFVMKAIRRDKTDRIKDWDTFMKELGEIKRTGVKATEAEEEKYRGLAEKMIRSSSRRKGLQNFWRKRRKAIAIAFSVLLLIYIINITGGSEPYITEDTSARQVVEYFYQAIDEKNTVLLDEVSVVDLKRLDGMVAETHVLEKMRTAYNYQNEEGEGIFGIKNLSILKLSGEPEPVYEAHYILYYNMSEESEDVSENNAQPTEELKHYEMNMTDKLVIEKVEGLWRIVDIEGSIDNVIKGKLMNLLE